MDQDPKLTQKQIVLAAKAASIHRSSLRRKLDRMTPGSALYRQTLEEIEETQALVTTLQSLDLAHLGHSA